MDWSRCSLFCFSLMCFGFSSSRQNAAHRKLWTDDYRQRSQGIWKRPSYAVITIRVLDLSTMTPVQHYPFTIKCSIESQNLPSCQKTLVELEARPFCIQWNVKRRIFTVCFSGSKLLFYWSHLSWISRQICCGTLELVLESNPHTSADYRLIPITSRIQTKMKGSKQSIGVWEMFDVWL